MIDMFACELVSYLTMTTVSDKQQDIIWLIKHLNKELELDYNKRLEEHGLTCQQARILFFIIKRTNNNEVVHQNDIEKEFELSKSTVSGLVNRMANKNLIYINKDSNKSIITATEYAHNQVDEIRSRKDELTKQILSGYSNKEKSNIVTYLQTLIKNMKGEK